MTAFRILLATAFVYGICRAAGQLFLRGLRLDLLGYERPFLEFLTGSALVSSAVFFLAASHLIYTSVLVAAGTLLMLSAALVSRRDGIRQAPAPPDLSPAWRALFLAPYLVFAALYIIAAMSPEISPDGAGYHLGLVARYYDHRGFYAVPNYMFAGLSAGIEMLFLVAFAIGRHSAAAMVHLLFLLTLPFGMLAWARRVNLPRAGVIGALFFYVSPLVGKDATVAYIDVAAAAVVFGVFCFLEVWRTDRQARALVPAGLLAGFAFACKITTATAIPYAVLYVICTGASRRTPWRVSLRMAGLTTLCATLTAVPWMVKDAIQYHNPFFPLFNAWFPNPYQYPIVEVELRRFMAHVSDVPYWKMPYEAVMGGQLIGVFGPLFALSPFGLLALRGKPGRLLWLAFLPLFLPFFTNTGARFLIPALPFVTLALGVALTSVPRIGSALATSILLLHSVLSWPTMMRWWTPVWQWRIEQMDWRIALRVIPEKRFLEGWPLYQPGLMLDKFVPAGDRVFSPSVNLMAYHHREVLGTFDSALGRRAWVHFLMPLSIELGATWNREIHFPPVTARGIRLVADTKLDADFRLSEVRFRLGANEIPREPAWRLTASANPWEIQYAFDNSRASWWTSGRTAEPGQWIEVDFGRAVELDRVLVEQSRDQRWISLRPQVREGAPPGTWKALHARESDYEEPPRESLRMEVRDELKALGIRWILIPDGSYGAHDLRDKAAYWGITQVAEANGYRLWKLN